MEAKPCLHQNPSGICWGAAITATLQANPSAVPGCPRHTGLLCSLCSLPTQPSSLHQHIHQSLLAEAFVLCLHRKVWARGSHSCCQHGMIFIDKSIIDPAPSRRTFTCCGFAGDVWIQTQVHNPTLQGCALLQLILNTFGDISAFLQAGRNLLHSSHSFFAGTEIKFLTWIPEQSPCYSARSGGASVF